MTIILSVVWIGVGATAIVDLWALLRRALWSVPAPDFGLVGRWFGHMPRGVFRHDSIAQAPTIRHEGLIGWSAHYLIGILFSAALVMWRGASWLSAPAPGPAITLGVVTVVAPLFLMQPGMGAGIAARRTPRPAMARLHSLVTHAVFGAGLYFSAVVLLWLREVL